MLLSQGLYARSTVTYFHASGAWHMKKYYIENCYINIKNKYKRNTTIQPSYLKPFITFYRA